jgi:2-dehydro-3-deoxygluconokinase
LASASAARKATSLSVVVKDAERGCAAFIDSETFEVPAIPVRVIDPVGAGDAFVAGYLADLLVGWPPRDRLTTASAAGAFAVSVPGDCEGLPRRSDLQAMLAYEDIAR